MNGWIDEVLDLALGSAGGRLRRVPSAGALYPVDAHVRTAGGLVLHDPRTKLGLDGEEALVLLSLVPQRTMAKYGSRSLPSLLLDLGHAAASIAAAASALGVTCRLRLDLDAHLYGPPYPMVAVHLSCADPVVEALHDLQGWERSAMPRFDRSVLEGRRSAFAPFTGDLAVEDLAAVMGGLIAVTAEGLVTADGPIGRGDARPTLAGWATEQDFLADAAAVVLYASDLTDYRAAHLRAGLEVHQALLAAEERGLPARPIGSWGPADLGQALGRPPGELVILHGAVIGGRRDSS